MLDNLNNEREISWKTTIYVVLFIIFLPLILFIYVTCVVLFWEKPVKKRQRTLEKYITFHVPDYNARLCLFDEGVRDKITSDKHCQECRTEIPNLMKIKVTMDGCICHSCFMREKLHFLFLWRTLLESGLQQMDIVNHIMHLLTLSSIDKYETPIGPRCEALVSTSYLKLHREFQFYPYFIRTKRVGDSHKFLFKSQ